MRQRRMIKGTLRSLLLAAIALVAFGCTRDDGISDHDKPMGVDGPGDVWGDVAIDKTLIYEGSTYYLRSIEDTQFVDSTPFDLAGLGSVEGTLDPPTPVFILPSETNTVYTTTPAGQAPAWVRLDGDFEAPGLWYRWQLRD